tara:strand:- start:50 stop:178 length:129 start_codon:yes stop_codon:yes gene_type:complete
MNDDETKLSKSHHFHHFDASNAIKIGFFTVIPQYMVVEDLRG